jgi:preprotein translocase SecE subunit
MANDTPQAPRGVALPGSRRGPKGFFAETMREMRKVNWPSKRETTRLTGIVLCVCIGQTFVLLILQYLFGAIMDIAEKGHI